jgi:hypothetical protein
VGGLCFPQAGAIATDTSCSGRLTLLCFVASADGVSSVRSEFADALFHYRRPRERSASNEKCLLGVGSRFVVDRRCSLVARMMLRNAEAVPCPSPGFG